MNKNFVYIVVPNWNGDAYLKPCIDSLLKQQCESKFKVLIVDNGSTDESRQTLGAYGDKIETVYNRTNLGFAGGVNTGIRHALEAGATHIALFNNDAVAERVWLKNLLLTMKKYKEAGIVTSRFLNSDGSAIDSTGDFYTAWGMSFPRGRDKKNVDIYKEEEMIFGASGGASLYRASLFRDIGLFDEDFFAYYEDVDISFRAQLRGWKVVYSPVAIAYHQIGGTSKKISGFTTYQTFKNFFYLFWKNMPMRLVLRYGLRVHMTYLVLLKHTIRGGNGRYALKGLAVCLLHMPKKLFQRTRIQRGRTVGVEYIDSILTKELPKDQTGLIRLSKKMGWL